MSSYNNDIPFESYLAAGMYLEKKYRNYNPDIIIIRRKNINGLNLLLKIMDCIQSDEEEQSQSN